LCGIWSVSLQEEAAMVSGLLLHKLQAATQVMRLSLTRDCYDSFAACSSAMQALAGLTHLCSISISSWDLSVCPAPLFRALQGVSGLTSLTVGRVTGTSKLRYLPEVSFDLGLTKVLHKFDRSSTCLESLS
jgi:hypothetical protein